MKVSSFLKRAAVVAVGLAAVFAAGGARAEYSGDYVQDGLVAMWDGYENVGVYSHDAAATKWVDLVRGAEITLPSWVSVEAHSLYSTAAKTGKTATKLASITGLSSADTNWTIEVVQQGIVPWRYTDNYNNLQSVFGCPRGALGYRQDDAKGFYFFGPKSATQCQLQNWVHKTAQVTDVHTMSAALGTSKETDSIWMDGVQDTVTLDQSYTANNASAFSFFGNERMDIRVYAIRIYNRALTQDEVAANHAVDVARFVDGDYSGAFIRVKGSPSEIGSPSPDYGITNRLVVGENYTFTCPAVYTNAAKTVGGTCRGWTLRKANGAVSSGSELTKTIAYDATMAGATLTWNWDVDYKVTATSEAGGQVSNAAQWVRHGASFVSTFSLVDETDTTRCLWRWVDADDKKLGHEKTLNIVVNSPLAITAKIGPTIYVDATNGHDDTGDGSSGNPYQTLPFAYSKASDGSTILLKDGTYYSPSSEMYLFVTNAVTIKSVNGPANCTVTTGVASGNARGILRVNHDDAIIEGLTVRGGYIYNTSPGSPVILYAGLVTNCVIRNNQGGSDGNPGNRGGVCVVGGALKNSLICANKAVYNNDATGRGGGVYLEGGLVENCVISNNCAGGYGAGVHVTSGILRDSLVAENHGIYSVTTKIAYGGGVAIFDGTVERCVIRGNYGQTGAGVYLSGGKLLNSLVVGNFGKNAGGGIWNAGGTVEFCTVVGNTANATSTGTGFNQTSGTAQNTVVYGNPCDAKGDTTVTGGTFDHNFTMLPITGYADNQSGDPHYRDAAKGDYRLLVGSKAIDGGVTYVGAETDIAGVTRPQGTAPDMGCYEYVSGQGALTCSFNSSVTAGTKFYKTGEASFTGSADGADLAGLTYTWYFDGVQQSATGTTIDWNDIGLGSHTVKLVVSNTAGETYEYVQEGVVKVSTDHVYANVNGSDTYPYDTSAKGAHKLQDALDAVMDPPTGKAIVTVEPGRYCPYSKWFVIERPLLLESAQGPHVTILYGNDPNGDMMEDRRVGRVLYVNHADALVSGFSVSNGWWYSYVGDSGPGGMRLAQGVVTNCFFAKNRGGNAGGAIQMSGGLLTDCRICDNYTRYNNDYQHARGGGVYLTGGTVANCEIYRNYAVCNDDNGTGSGVWMNGGMVTNCVIHSNFGKYTSQKGIGLGMTGGLAVGCTITNNSKAVKMAFPKNETGFAVNDAAGVYVTGGILRNCLVADNASKKSGSGVYQKGGTVEYCTVTANSSEDKVNSGLYLNGAAAICRYNVLWGNGVGTDSEPNCNISYTTASSFTKNIVKPATSGTDNIASDPGFTDAAHGDWTLGAGSPAIDAGPTDDDVTIDLAGNLRPKDGDGDGDAANDLGCYEAPDASEGPLACNFTPASTVALGSADVTFEATAVGRGATGTLTYTWDFGGGTVLSGAGTATPTVRFASAGSYTVRLTVAPAEGEPAKRTNADCVKIGSPVVFVNAANTHAVWPYDTWAKAATDLEEALSSMILSEAVRTKVTVTNGTYRITAKTLSLTYPVELVSVEGPEKTTLRGSNPKENCHRCLDVANAGAFVSGFTLANGAWDGLVDGDYGGGALRISSGVVSNCVVSGAYGYRTQCGAVSVKGTGVLTHTLIRNSYCTEFQSGGASQYGGGLLLSENGVAQHLVISNCYAHKGGGCSGGCVAVYGGTLSDSQILDGYIANDSVNGSVVYQTGGTIERCVIGDTKNRNTHGAAIYQTGGTLRDSLVYGARAKTQAQALYLTGGTFVNNTVVTNGYNAAHASPVAATVAGGTVANCLFALNATGDVSVSSGTVTYSRFAEATGTDGNISAAPKFRNPDAGDWRLAGDSPCVNAGDWHVLGATKDAVRAQKDLLGAARLQGANVDMGACEARGGGFTVIVR